VSQADPAREPSLTSAQRELVRAHLSLVDDVAFRELGRLAATDLPRLRSFGAAGLIDAAQKYDSTKGAQFRTYAWWRVRGAIRNGLRGDGSCTRELIERGVLSADEHTAWMRDGDSATQETEEEAKARFAGGLAGYAGAWVLGWMFGGRADDPETALQKGSRERALREMSPVKDSLPPRDQQVIHLRDELGLTWPQVAEAMEISEATAHRYHHGAVERLGKRLCQRLEEGQRDTV
jgi:RNA polymerase sigma factor for flagellar operon FliA